MKRSTYLFQLLLLLVVKVFISACDPDLPTAPCGKGPGENNIDLDPIDITKDYYSEETFKFEFASNQKSKFTLDGVNGSIYVEQSHDQNSFYVSGKKKAYSNSQQDAEDQLKNLDVVLEDYSEELKVTTLHPTENGERNYSVDYWIKMPKNIELQILSTNSNVTLKEIEGNVNVEITNGKIDAQVSLPRYGEVKMKNVNGDMKLSLPQATSAEFDAKSSTGKVKVKNLDLSSMTEKNHSMNGVLGNGQGVIELKISNGDIDVFGF